MICVENCNCILCRELPGCETNIESDKYAINDNFILSAPKNVLKAINTIENNAINKTSENFFIQNDKTKKSNENKNSKPEKNKEEKEFSDSVHKSVIYISGTLSDSKSNINNTENIDDSTILASNAESEERNIINVIFKNSFNNAQQIINDVNCANSCCDFVASDNDDDFPLGMEADLLNRLQNKRIRQRLSNNSRPDHSYQSTDSPSESNKDKETKQSSPRVNTPANLIQPKPVLYSSTVQELSQNSNINDRMVSPKRKNEYFPHLYNVANNVKTSTFNENSNQNNVKNVNQLSNNNDYSARYSGNHSNMVPERDTGPKTVSSGQVNAVGSLRLPVCNTSSSKNNNGDEKINGNEDTRMTSSRPHHHVSVHELRMQRGQHCNSSSDDNRSSGHASMSDTGNSSPRDVTDGGTDRLTAEMQRSIRNRVSSQHAKFRHRATPAKLQVPWTGGGGLEDIKMAIQQLTMRSHTSTSTYSSVSAGSESSEPTVRRLMRHSSLETINTNVTSADEFVWIESHNRLVELQHLPWTHHCILRVLQTGRCRDHMSRVNVETIPRLSYLLQRALVRLGRETQRLSSTLGLCSKHEVTVAFRIILCPPLADSCIKACLRAAAMFAVSGDCTLRQNKSSRAGLQLHVGRFHRWMTDVKLGKFVHEYAAVYLCAGLENLLEEILLQCLPNDSDVTLTATLLEHAIANNGDLWGLLQPYAHLNAGRIASGALALPRWASVSSLGSSRDSGRGSGPPEPSLLTTCVGSLQELQDLVSRMQSRIPLCARAIRTLFYFMRCSQLEHGEQNGGAVQELCYERAYVVLPPLVEWLRVAVAHGEHRHAAVLDRDDIMQAARLLLPGVDCPVRSLGEEAMRIRKSTGIEEDSIEATRQIQMELAFRLMASGRPELIQQAIPLLPPTTRLDTLNHQGHSALMLAAIQNDEFALMSLLDAGASVDIETPSSSSSQYPAVNVECQHWTALTYAAALGHTICARLLLERSANVEGGAALSEDKCTLTPLQVASGSGNLDMVQLLLAHGAHPFISTQLKDTLCYSGSAQRGSYSPISVAAAHGQRSVLQKLLSQPMTPVNKEVLSLEEMLAEGAGTTASHKNDQCNAATNATAHFSKAQIKALQEAMYHSAENNHLEITVEIRSMGVPWTLHCWMHTLSAAHEARLDCVIDQLLQDFLQVCPDDYSSQFVQECLPLLFNIFRYSKKEGTTLLLADIFSTCFGWEPIKPIRDCVLTGLTGSRIDPKYVNNPELSDVTFRVEGRLFYGHKIVLVTASPRLRAMLSSKLCEGGLPTVQINDIRYHIFQIVMQFLYQGGCQTLEPANEDVLELMAAANFFQLDGLLRYCEGRCAAMLTLDNVVSMYIHAKVYNAVQLLEYCQGFLLQNMVALLTYDDSVKRLLFAKKLPNHDVLAGLLLTLQNRIKIRRSQTSFKPTQSQIKVNK